MIEALITCNEPCDIPDLGIFKFMRGEERWVSDAKALASKDLKKEQMKGNVSVTRKSRRNLQQSPKRPQPPFVAQSRPSNQERSAVKPETVVEKTVVQEVDTDKLKQDLLGELLPGLRAVVADEIRKATAESAPQAPAQSATQQGGIDAAQMADVLESVLRRVAPSGVAASSSGTSRKPSGPEEPLFIPGKIVAKDAKAKIDVKQKATEGGDGIDDAQEALRALKRKKRGRKNVEENES